MDCFKQDSEHCKFCDEKINPNVWKNRYGDYCSKVCRMIDLEDSLIEEKQKLKKKL